MGRNRFGQLGNASTADSHVPISVVDLGGEIISEEICNGMDDDCNGLVDENLIQSCETFCGSGTKVCSDGLWSECSARQPQPEIIDGIDNDCDGEIDFVMPHIYGEELIDDRVSAEDISYVQRMYDSVREFFSENTKEKKEIQRKKKSSSKIEKKPSPKKVSPKMKKSSKKIQKR